MKNITRGIWILAACGIVLGLIFGLRALLKRDENVAAAAVLPTAGNAAEEPELDLAPEIDTPEVQPTVVELLDPGQDLKRGSFLTEAILAQLGGIVAKETLDETWVGASQVVQGDTRAFLKICMAQENSEERLMFGGPIWLDFPGGKTDAFFVHNDISDENGAACQVLEFVGVNFDGSQAEWRFNMESVMFALPDEGTECGVYQKRAEADKDLREAGITVACNKGEGVTNLEILFKPAGIDEADAQKMVDDAVLGRHNGPWIFELPVEPGLVQANP